MPITINKKSQQYSYSIWLINESLDELTQALNPNKHELSTINQIRNIDRRKQNIAARLTLNHLATKKTQLHYLYQKIPYCNCFKYISISHSNKYCVVINSNKPIGIDIQYRNPNIMQLSNKFMNEFDKQHISLKNQETQSHFIWCAKESIYKTLNNKPCSLKNNIYIEIQNQIIKYGYYKKDDCKIDYEIECELLENYFIAIAKKIS